MSLFTAQVTVAVTAYPGTAQVQIPFTPKRVTITNEDDVSTVIATFDANEDQIRVPPIGGGLLTASADRVVVRPGVHQPNLLSVSPGTIGLFIRLAAAGSADVTINAES